MTEQLMATDGHGVEEITEITREMKERTPESPLRGRSTDRKVDIRIIFWPNSMSLYGLWELPHFFEVFIRIMRTTSRKNQEKSEKIEKNHIF